MSEPFFNYDEPERRDKSEAEKRREQREADDIQGQIAWNRREKIIEERRLRKDLERLDPDND